MSFLSKISIFLKTHYFTALLLSVILLGFILRYWYASAGLPYLYYWDEPQTASTALKMMKTGDLNPHFFNYGSMMIYSNLIVDILHYLSLMGHPPTAENYLTNMNEIKISADVFHWPGWHWTISHPSFYFWNRILTVFLGTGTVLIVYFIGKHTFNRWVGFIAALFLAFLPYHITQSAKITPDAPVAFFVLTVVLFSVIFIKYKKLSYFIISLSFAGIAIATKYNAGLSITIPFIALCIVYLRSKESVKVYMWFLIPIIPTVVFFMIMPYAIIDLTTFLRDVGYEIRHYKVHGHGVWTSIPGWDHLSFQINQFYHHLGMGNIILIALGFIGIFIKPLFGFTLLLPVFYISYMIGMKVNIHRNYVQIYPFFALLFASGVYVFYIILRVSSSIIQKKILPMHKWMPIAMTGLLAIGYLLPQGYKAVDASIKTYKRDDTRTQVINVIKSMKDIQKVVFAKELRMHFQDLRRLNTPYRIVPLLKMTKKTSDDSVLYVLPSNITSFYKANEKKLLPLVQFISDIDKNSIVKHIGKKGKTRIDIFSISPAIILVKDLPHE